MHSLVQAYEDPKEENRHVLQEAASYHHPRPYSESVSSDILSLYNSGVIMTYYRCRIPYSKCPNIAMTPVTLHMC